MNNKTELLTALGPDIKRMIRDYMADMQGDLRVAGDALVTGRMTVTNLSLDGRDIELGWIKGKIGWFYGSSTTILVYGEDLTDIFQKGTKLRWKQGGGWLYAYVVGFSYASGVNTLTITGSTVTNTDITENYFSYSGIAPGHPEWFNWTPTYSASGSMTFTSVTTNYAYYRVLSDEIEIWLRATGTTGGTASNIIYYSLPVIPSEERVAFGQGVLDTGYLSAFTIILSATINARIYKTPITNYSLKSGFEIYIGAKYKF